MTALSNVQGNLGIFTNLVLGGEEVSGVGTWTPTLLVSTLLPNTDINNSLITNLVPSTLGVTVSQSVPASGSMFYGHSPASVLLDATQKGFYIKPKTSFTNFSASDDAFFLAISDAAPPSMFNFGLKFQRVASNDWEIRSLTSDVLLVSSITDAEILNGNIAASFSTDGTNITVNAYLNGSEPSSPVGSETVLASGVGITAPLTTPMAFVFNAQNTASEQMTFEHLTTPDIDYDNITQFSGGTDIDPASYPTGRESKVYSVIGLSGAAVSTIGTMVNGSLASFDDLGALSPQPINQLDNLTVVTLASTTEAIFSGKLTASSDSDIVLEHNSGGVLTVASSGVLVDANPTEDLGVVPKQYADGLVFNVLNNFENTQRTADFTAVAGNYHAVQTDGVAAIVVTAPISPKGGDQVLIASKDQGVETFAPDISDFSTAIMVVGTNVTLTFFSTANFWLITGVF